MFQVLTTMLQVGGDSGRGDREVNKEYDKDEGSRWQIAKCPKFIMAVQPIIVPRENAALNNQQPDAYNNPQTEAFTAMLMLEIENKINPQ
ncbi:uncharacterized protein STEHIDRAFT_160800 [Stereum hirsutum FP-91666 SS1]|uniref:uncharacterized protein n=1 Tax=Stereum hirsutum (strain FP-91666) TaxID=721885 RepID=UPI00044494FD|nr:uncharacterized protein STEHIDRAFT_160800 [Stereum hirsutum FP-91666 SS1]EIM82245.1 hypothetical protein STEHIDRAFT_160800 [Stereum hirsutum FP-91666 SS1]